MKGISNMGTIGLCPFIIGLLIISFAKAFRTKDT
jgi:hypothetical protein